MKQQLSTARATTFRDTWLWQFCRRQLKRNRSLYLIVSWIVKAPGNLYFFTTVLIKNRSLPLVPLARFPSLRRTPILPASKTATRMPQVFPDSLRLRVIPPQAEYVFPEIHVATISNGLVAGGSNLVRAGDVVICHDLFDPVRDYSSEELHRRTFVRPGRNQIAWLMPAQPQRTLARAANFTDACAANYAHWSTEVLPRISLFCENENFAGIPLLIDAGLHRNLMESLRVVAGEGREIVTLAPGETAAASELFVVSVTGYVPFKRRSNRIKGHSHGTFSLQALLHLRERIWRNLPPARKTATRIVIRRNSGIRMVTNEQDIEMALVARGFSVVEPERLSFAEQVELFSNAEIVVGATGAAFANLIFCPPSAKIIIMISNYRHMPYWYWQNMACAVGNQVTYVLGPCTDTFAHLHSNFRINPAEVLSAIEQSGISG